MRVLRINKRKLYYREPVSSEMEVDSDGNLTGEKFTVYGDWVEIMANYSAGHADIGIATYGLRELYDRAIAFEPDKCPLTETSEVYIGEEAPEAETPANYMVSAIKDSINGIIVELRKVKKS